MLAGNFRVFFRHVAEVRGIVAHGVHTVLVRFLERAVRSVMDVSILVMRDRFVALMRFVDGVMDCGAMFVDHVLDLVVAARLTRAA